MRDSAVRGARGNFQYVRFTYFSVVISLAYSGKIMVKAAVEAHLELNIRMLL